MRGTTVVEVKYGDENINVAGVVESSGVKIVSSKMASRPGWIKYELRSTSQKYKIFPVPGYIFIGVSYCGGRKAKWRSLHAQTFPSEVYKPLLFTYNLTTENWYDVVQGLFEAGAAEVKVHKKQFASLIKFQRYCDETGVWRVIQAEKGMNK